MRILVIGAGGHGRVVADALLEAARADVRIEVVGFVDDNRAPVDRAYGALPIVGGLDALSRVPHDRVVVAIGDNDARRRVWSILEPAGEELITSRHPACVVSSDVDIGLGSMISAGALLMTGVRLGRGVIVNTGAIVDHDSVVADWAHVAPGAVLGGGVQVGALTLIGLGARVLPGRRIGRDVTVGAGAVVTVDMPDGVTCVGVPARIIPVPG